MTDFRPAEESYATAPPHVVPGHPWSWTTTAAVPAVGEVQLVDPTTIAVHATDAAGVDRSGLLLTAPAGTVIQATYGQGQTWSFVTDALGSFGGGAVTFTGTVIQGTFPGAGTPVTLQFAPPPIGVTLGDEPEPVDPVDVDVPLFDPGDYTVDEVKAYIDDLADASPDHDQDPDVVAETQRVLDAEVAGMNRSTLVDWLDHRYGVVHP